VDRSKWSRETIAAPTGHLGSFDLIAATVARQRKYSSQLSTCSGIKIDVESTPFRSGAVEDKAFCNEDINIFPLFSEYHEAFPVSNYLSYF
jgi:hypothetical protein